MATDTPTPRPSSTVVLVRPAAKSPEVFMVKRHASASFGSKFAFPGGVLETSDSAVLHLCNGVTPDRANQLLDLPGGALEYYSAAGDKPCSASNTPDSSNNSRIAAL